MRGHHLQAPRKGGNAHGPKAHDGTINTQEPGIMWGTDMTTGEGLAHVFVAVDHCTCEIVHDSLPRRGFGDLFQIREGGQVAGYGFVMGYSDEPKDIICQFYLLPSCRGAAQRLFRHLIDASQARRILTQSNDILLTLMLYDFAAQIISDTIFFHDAMTSHLSVPGVVFRRRSDPMTKVRF